MIDEILDVPRRNIHEQAMIGDIGDDCLVYDSSAAVCYDRSKRLRAGPPPSLAFAIPQFDFCTNR